MYHDFQKCFPYVIYRTISYSWVGAFDRKYYRRYIKKEGMIYFQQNLLKTIYRQDNWASKANKKSAAIKNCEIQ